MNDFNLSSHHAIVQDRQADMAAEAARNRLVRQTDSQRSYGRRKLRLAWTFKRQHDVHNKLRSAWTIAQASR